MKKIIKLLFYLFFPLFVGVTISFLIKNHIDYTNLVKPLLAPPKILFPIVWTIIYLLMGISYTLYKKNFSKVDFLYYLQLFVNAGWSIIFFLWKARLLAIIWIILLDILVIALIFAFSKEEKISAYLNIPYLIWSLFATYLTIGIYILN